MNTDKFKNPFTRFLKHKMYFCFAFHLCLSVFICGSFLFSSSTLLAEEPPMLAPTPPMGWNSWNTFQTHIDEKLIKATADTMIANGMRDAGYIYINLDDGWSMKDRDAQGNLVGDVERFPSGMKALGDYLHAKGFKFGLYNCAGTQTCAGYPGALGHEAQDAKTYASWGVDYLKYDWCHSEGLNAPEAYKKMSDALRATGRPIVFSICEWGQSKPWTWGAGVGQLWRTTGDITDIYDGKEKWSQGWKLILDQQVGLEKYAGPGHWNDPDMLEVGNHRMTFPESRAHFSLWCMLAAPLIAGNDVTHMSDPVRELLTNREVIALDQDPLGKQGTRVHQSEGKEIWAKELSGGEWAVCLFNTGKEQAKLELKWRDLDFLKGQYQVRDLLGKKEAGDTASDFSGELESHDVVMFRLKAKT
jgi:alpha-galactosidase